MPLDDLIQFPNSQSVQVHVGDCIKILQTLPECYFQTCVTSPPYFGLRDYQVDDQIGKEETPEAYVVKLVAVFSGVRRVLRDDGTIWLNLGDSYASGGNGPGSGKQLTNVGAALPAKRPPLGFKAKDLLGIPWRVAFALQADGWYLRSAIVWHKPNPMPESVQDRPTSAYEMVFLLAKSEKYFYDADAVKENALTPNRKREKRNGESAVDTKMRGYGSHCGTEGGTRNVRNVWTIATQPFKGAHFATMSPELAQRCVLAGCPEGGSVLDPFGGAGTTGLVAGESNRLATLIELNPEYAEIARNRLGHLVVPAD
jgi:site-specific DNA-methyltransferase (adenine-specific)